MEKEIIIAINGLQSYEGQEPDSVELVTSGTLSQDGEVVTITYEESELTGMESTTTTMKIEPECVTIMRFGQTRSHMVFQEGQKHLSYYDTPYGSLTVGVKTNRIIKKLGEHSGRIEIYYAMEINSALAGENSFCLKFHDAQGNIEVKA